MPQTPVKSPNEGILGWLARLDVLDMHTPLAWHHATKVRPRNSGPLSTPSTSGRPRVAFNRSKTRTRRAALKEDPPQWPRIPGQRFGARVIGDIEQPDPCPPVQRIAHEVY